jgi:hypothetical protein
MESTVKIQPDVRLERILAALEQELINADDHELMDVVDELGLKPSMKGSVALFGVTRRLQPWPQRPETVPAETPSAQKKAPRISDRRGSE